MRSLFRPLGLAILFAVGIAFAPVLDRTGIPSSARWVAALALAVIATRRREVLLAAVLALGTARGAAQQVEPPSGVDDRVIDQITGEVLGPVVRTARGTGARLETAGATIWIWSDDALVPGERIAVTGYLASPRGSRGPSLPDPAAAILTRGAHYELTARSIERLADEPGVAAYVWRWAADLQARGTAAIDNAGGDPIGSAALRGIAVGDRTRVPPELDARWRATGIYHVLSVSGLHLFIVAMLVFIGLRLAIAASPWGGRVRPASWAAPPTLVLAIAYTLITGAQLATVRALIVVAIVLAAAMLERPVRLVDALGVAALAILVWRPADLFDAGFQLSFTAALTLAVRPNEDRELLRGGWLVRQIRKLPGWARRAFVTSTWVSITTAPITAFHFQEVAVGGVVGNVLMTFFLEWVALPTSLIGLVAGCDTLVWLASWIVGIVDRGTELLAPVMPIGRVAVASPIVLVVLVVLSIVLARRQRRTRADVIVWIALCLAWALGRTPPPADALRVTFVDVGQGDAALVELPGGEVWLVDAGGFANARDLAAASAPGRTISRVLAGYGHAKIDVAIISHPHPDHYLGLAGLDVPIGELWFAPESSAPLSGKPPGATSFASIRAALAARGTRLVSPPLGLARTESGVELVTWAPRYQPAADAPIALAADPVRTVNDNSLVVAVRYRGRTILFTGDLEAEGEEALVAAGLGHVDVVKVPHHGSRTSSTPAFVAATHPTIAVISCGRANQFRFPAASVVERWRAAGADIARTDTNGAITVIVDDDGDISVDRYVTAP